MLPKTPLPPCYVIHEQGVNSEISTVSVNPDYGLLFTTKGSFKMEQSYTTQSVTGSITIVPYGVPYRSVAGCNLDYWLLGFSAESYGLNETQEIMRPFAEVRSGGAPVANLNVPAQQRITSWFEALKQETNFETTISNDVQRSLIVLILTEVVRATTVIDNKITKSPLVGKALHYIQKYSLTPISLSDVASAVGRTSPHVASVVKSETGFTVGMWITSARLAKAAQLLQYSNMSVEQITTKIGWQDTTHFIRQFKTFYGTTPSKWRNKLRSKSEH
ncbi:MULTISPECIES: AraC family transcriptional regulator [unclassified Pseudoalteromonas]|uniref:helix-turn-helix domain-containing protein n=1 Tax=unclassified Pseudoalteromonas TaxID=194690 RepID=UPI0004154B44|nr:MULTISPECIES: AraC family transcriptional regulator [unclassified Pseudoalteromonas]MBB1419655.1 helix-turn-helix transcriptional regulator [Pseudoalteromonas sp. SG44-1]URQ85547.1 helix-turn-helix transcriptional regulator [Pseudoalteromonas sp. SCSIO 43088]